MWHLFLQSMCDTNMASGIRPRISKSLSPLLYQVIKKPKQSKATAFYDKEKLQKGNI